MSKLLRQLLLSALFAFSGLSTANAGQIFWVDWQDTVVEGGVTKYRGRITVTRPDLTTVVVIVKFTPPTAGVAFFQASGGTDYWAQGGSGSLGRNPARSPYTSTVVDNIPTGTDIIGLRYAGQNTLEFADVAGGALQIGNPVFAYVSLNGNGYGFNQDFDILSYGDPATGNDIGFFGTGTSYKSVVGSQFQLLGTGEPHGALQFKGAFSTVNWQSLSPENWNGFTIGVPGLAADIPGIPIPNAGADQTVNANASCQAAVQLTGSISGSTDPNISYTWTGSFGTVTGLTPVVTLPLGVHNITLTVRDSRGATGTDTVIITVRDVTLPTLNCSPLPPMTAGANCSAVVPNVLAGVFASDNCTPPNQLIRTQIPAAGTVVGLGNHTITVMVTDASGNIAICQSTLSVSPGVAFGPPVPDVFPGTPFLTCILGNFQEPSRIQNWKLRWAGPGTAVNLTVAATTVNVSESPGSAIVATVTDQTGFVQTVIVAHPITQTDNLGTLSLSLQPGTIYDLAIRRTGQAAHYKLGSPDKRLEIGFAHPLLYLEHHEQAWVVNATPNENVNISVLSDPPAGNGAGPHASTLTYSVRRPNCTVVVPSTTIPVNGTIAFNAGGGGGSFVIYFESMDGHFALRRNSGCDGGFYALPCPPKVQIACPVNITRPNDAGLCGASVSFAATATGICSPTVTYSKAPGSFFPVGTTAVTATATDIFGKTAICTFTVTVTDAEPPKIVAPASNKTIECDVAGNAAALNAWLTLRGGATATDNCGNVTWSHNFTGLSDGCGATGAATVTFTARDGIGNISSTTATFTIADTKAPTIVTPAANLTVECDGAGNTAALSAWLASNGGATATDACGTVQWSHNFKVLSDLCGATGAATVMFIATDECGIASTTTATFTIVDTKAPTILTPAANLTVECDGAGNTAALSAWLASNGGATATDACGTVRWSHNFTALSDLCGATGAATVTFVATDECGNTSTSTATFTIVDTTAPTLTSNVRDILPKEAPITFTLSGQDICGGVMVTVTKVTAHAINGAGKVVDKAGSAVWQISGGQVTIVDSGGVGTIFTIYGTSVDNCGNTTTGTFVVNVLRPANEGVGNGVDGNTPGHDNNGGNDDPGFTPGNPGAKNKKGG